MTIQSRIRMALPYPGSARFAPPEAVVEKFREMGVAVARDGFARTTVHRNQVGEQPDTTVALGVDGNIYALIYSRTLGVDTTWNEVVELHVLISAAD